MRAPTMKSVRDKANMFIIIIIKKENTQIVRDKANMFIIIIIILFFMTNLKSGLFGVPTGPILTGMLILEHNIVFK